MQKSKKDDLSVNISKPHTIKKFELIEGYVKAWAPKLLNLLTCKGIVFIDCMSNSGLYEDEFGNPVEGTPIRVARILDGMKKHFPDKDVLAMFNDIEPRRITVLKQKLSSENFSPASIITSVTDANDFLKEFDHLKYKDYNVLLLYDPYLATIDWDAITPFLNRWGEVIINHMVSDTVRGAAQAHKTKIINRYQTTYQKEIEEIICVSDRKHLEKIVTEIIRKQTKARDNKFFLASFPFFNRTNGAVYNLIHYGMNIEGHKLFKTTAWKTFGGKSSLKNTHGTEIQFCLDLNGNGGLFINTDEDCYFVKDIAKYIYDKYKGKGEIQLERIYEDLDVHPIFPSQGYRPEIKKELEMYNTQIHKSSIIFQ